MFIDTHCHIDGPEFDADRIDAIQRAKDAGCQAIFVPATDLASSKRVLELCHNEKGYLWPMIGLHPEEVRPDWHEQLRQIRQLECPEVIAIGEVGLDFYWSREYENEQLEAFEQQVQWSVESRLPLMIHCRKAQNELINILRPYKDQLPGGVFHCFNGNQQEAEQLLAFDSFALGIGGTLTFKKSKLPELLPYIPFDRLVLETDSPYMAPTPMRGQRNESAYITYIICQAAKAYGVTTDEIANATTNNALRIFDRVERPAGER